MVDEIKEKKMLTISKGSDFTVKIQKDMIYSISNQGEGVLFRLKNGIDINCVDPYMPNHTKQMIENSINRFFQDDNNVVIDLLNFNKPVQIFTPKN